VISVFKRNFWLKIASIGLAAMLWVAVVVIGQTVISVEVPVEFKNLGEGVLVSGSGARTVTLTLKGHERFLQNIKREDLAVTLDMEGKGVGRHSYAVRVSDVKHPPTVRVVSVKPALLNILIEERMSREVPVRAVITGIPKRGFSVRGVEVVPGTVRVEGASSIVRSRRRPEAGPVDVSGAIGDVAEEVLITPGSGVVLTDDSVTVKVLIGRE
jgi:YbbR domain-containing protein